MGRTYRMWAPGAQQAACWELAPRELRRLLAPYEDWSHRCDLGEVIGLPGPRCHLILNWGSDEMVPVHPAPNPLVTVDAPEGSGNVSPVLWSLTHAELPRSSPSAFVLLGQTPQSACLLGHR